MNDRSGGGFLVLFLIIVGVFILVLYLVIMAASLIALAAGAAGSVWGGGTAVLNYGKSFKENMIDSNRKQLP